MAISFPDPEAPNQWKPARFAGGGAVFIHSTGQWILAYVDRACPQKPGWYIWGPTASMHLITEHIGGAPLVEASVYCARQAAEIHLNE